MCHLLKHEFYRETDCKIDIVGAAILALVLRMLETSIRNLEYTGVPPLQMYAYQFDEFEQHSVNHSLRNLIKSLTQIINMNETKQRS